MAETKSQWKEYPHEKPAFEGYYLVISRDEKARAACYWNGFSWERDVIGTGMRAHVRAEDVKYFKEWQW